LLANTAQVAARVVPQSRQLGRERVRYYNQPQARRAEPLGPRVSLPGAVALEGAEKLHLKIRRNWHHTASAGGALRFGSLTADLTVAKPVEVAPHDTRSLFAVTGK
jgi:hypothetical protein